MTAQNRTEDARRAGAAHHISVVSTTVAFAMSQGMTMAEIEKATGLHGPALGDPEARLPDEIVPRLWRALVARAPADATITLEAARGAPFSALGGLAHGAQFAANLREALGFIVQNQRVLGDRLELRLVERAEEAVLCGYHPTDDIDQGRTAEVGVALTVRLVRELLRIRKAPSRIELAHGPLGAADNYKAFFKIPVMFGSAENAIAFPIEVMSKPVCGRNAELFAFVETHFKMVLNRLATEAPSPAVVRLRQAIIAGASRGDYNATTVAQRAGLSLRSAQRIAATIGTTLQSMLDEARASNAKTLLDDPTISIATIGTLVGYSDDRAFRRAFKRWTGVSPSQFRRRAG